MQTKFYHKSLQSLQHMHGSHTEETKINMIFEGYTLLEMNYDVIW